MRARWVIIITGSLEFVRLRLTLRPPHRAWPEGTARCDCISWLHCLWAVLAGTRPPPTKSTGFSIARPPHCGQNSTLDTQMLCKYHWVDDMNTHSVIVPNLSPLPPESPRILPAWFTMLTTSEGHISRH